MRTLRVLIAPHRVYLAACLMIAIALLQIGWAETWKKLGIGSLQPPFADLRTVQAGLDALRQGLDPQVVNPTDPWARPMNYPSVWLRIAHALHWEVERNYLLFAAGCGAAFAACCFDLLRRYPAWWVLVLALPGAPALLIERGNNDSVIFVLLYLAAVCARPVFVVLVPLATVLKLYPLLALPAFAGQRRAMLLAAAGCAAALLAIAPELGAIRSATPASPLLSFGLPVYAHALGAAGLPLPAWSLGAALLALTAATAALGSAWLQPAKPADPAAHRLFLAGAAVFLGASLLGANWDYRLCFLLMTTPYIAQLPGRTLRITLAVLMVVAFNQPLIEDAWGLPALRLNLLAKAGLFVLIGAIAAQAARPLWPRPSQPE